MSKRVTFGAFLTPAVICFLGVVTSLKGQDVISNGSFNTGIADWNLDPGVGNIQWSSSDRALLLTNDGAPPGQTASASQCDSITGGIFYEFSARVFPINFSGGPRVRSGLKRVEHTGTLYLLADFYDLDGCRGSGLPQFVRLSASGSDGAWQSLGQSFLSPNTAVSVLVSLAILKDQSGSDLQAEFDDVSMVPLAQPPPPPVVNFTYLPLSPTAGVTVQFVDSSSGAPSSWSWDFGDPASGSLNTSTAQNPAHLFATAGTYSVSLTATNAGGSGSGSRTITVVKPPPVAEFTFTPAAPAPGQTVQFTDTSTGSPTSWSWTFGDASSGAANTSTLQNPSHVFASPGVYSVTLAAKTAGGTGLRNHAVTVASTVPSASFTFTPTTPKVDATVQFTDTSSGGPTEWLWNFGDPGSGASDSSTLQNPSHVFSRGGTYSVTLTAGNAKGSNAVTVEIKVGCVRCPRVVQFRSVAQ